MRLVGSCDDFLDLDDHTLYSKRDRRARVREGGELRAAASLGVFGHAHLSVE